MKIVLTTGTWQDNPGCRINITLVSTSDVHEFYGPTVGLCNWEHKQVGVQSQQLVVHIAQWSKMGLGQGQ